MKINNTKPIYGKITLLAILVSLITYFIYKNIEDFDILLKVESTYLILLTITLLLGLTLNGMINKYIMEPFHIFLKAKEWFGLAVTTSFYNLITPFRGGMISKAAYLKSKHKFSYTKFLASMAGVYAIQFWMISLLGIISMIVIFIRYDIFNLIVSTIFLGLFLVLTAVIFFRLEFPVHKNRILNKLFEIGNGWLILKKNKKILTITIFVTISQIILSLIAQIVVYKAIGVHISIIQAIFLSTIGAVATIATITPGNLGITEAVAVLSALVLGITPVQSLSSAIVGRVVQTAVVLILGPIFSYILIKKPKLESK